MLLNNVAVIRKAIDELSEQEAKQVLVQLMLQLELAENNKDAGAGLYQYIKELYNELLAPRHAMQLWEPDAATARVHIAFGDSIAGSLKLAIKQLGMTDTNRVITFRDRYYMGPLWKLHEQAGRDHRREWFQDHIIDGMDFIDEEDESFSENEHQNLLKQIAAIPEQASVVIWCANNAYEQTGLRFAMYLLKHRENEIFVFNAADACERKFNRINRRIDYLYSGEISFEKIQAVFGEMTVSGPLTIEARRELEREWLALAQSREVLRIWNGNSIVSVEEDYFDSYLLQKVEELHNARQNREFIKAARVIGEAMGYCEEYVGDSFFEYRLRNLVYNGQLQIKGIPRAMRYYSVRRK